MEDKRLMLMIGLPFAGKSTYVKNVLTRGAFQVIEGASILKALQSEGIVADNNNMGPVYEVEKIMAKAFMNVSLPIIVDSRNLLVEEIFLWRQLAEENGYKIFGKIIDTPTEICLERATKQINDDKWGPHILMCSNRLEELKTMLAFKHQNLLTNYEVIDSGGK